MKPDEVFEAVMARLPHSWCWEHGWHEQDACPSAVTITLKSVTADDSLREFQATYCDED